MGKSKKSVENFIVKKDSKNYSFFDVIAKNYVDGSIERALEKGKLLSPIVDFKFNFEINEKDIKNVNLSFQYCNLMVDLFFSEEKSYLSAVAVNKNLKDGEELYIELSFENGESFIKYIENLPKLLKTYKYFNGNYSEKEEREKKNKKDKESVKKIIYCIFGLGIFMFLLYFIFLSRGTKNLSALLTGIYIVVSSVIIYIWLFKAKGNNIVIRTTILYAVFLLLSLILYAIIKDFINGTFKPVALLIYILTSILVAYLFYLCKVFSRRNNKR